MDSENWAFILGGGNIVDLRRRRKLGSDKSHRRRGPKIEGRRFSRAPGEIEHPQEGV